MIHRARTPVTLLALLAAPVFAAQPDTPADAPVPNDPAPPAIADEGASLMAAFTDRSNFRYRSVTGYFDNDGTYPNLINDTDRYYTAGLGFEVGFDFTPPDAAASRLAPGWTDPRFGVAVSLKQFIFTGIDLSDPTPAADDHPYAGWLTLGLALQRSDATRHDHFGIDLGIIGPSSMAEDIQRWIHDEFPDEIDPAGWDTQVRDEFAFNLTYQRTWRTERAERADVRGLQFDMLPAARVDAGTVFMRARGQATLRLGANLPDDFGPASLLGFRDHTARPDPSKDWSVYGYMTVAADAVGRDIFLDGSTFSSSRSTEREVLVARATLGVMARIKFVEFGWAQTFESNRFRAQPNGQTWGSFMVSVACHF
jgi:hypothetical protein